MKKLRLMGTGLLALFISACGSSDGMTSGLSPQVQEAYYNIYVGGTPEAGLSRSYFMVLDTLLPNYQVNTMQVDGRKLSLEKSADKHIFMGAERYGVKEELPKPQQLRLVLVKSGTDTLTITANEVVFKETITFPSAPPRD